MKKKRLVSFFKTFIAYKILTNNIFYICTYKRSYSKLKLITSLRLIISQERLSKLEILSIKREIIVDLEHKNKINCNLASQKVKKNRFLK